MRRDAGVSEVHLGKVIHLVGRMTDEVFSFLGPATLALAESGVEQTLVMVDDADCRRLLPRLHDSIDLVLTAESRSPIQRWKASLRALRASLQTGPISAVHLHGFVPVLLAPYVLRAAKITAPVYYSPHSSKALNSMSGLGMVLWWATRPVHNLARERPIVNMPVDARGLSGMLGEGSVELVESPVADVFFKVPRNETVRPLVLTGSRLENPRSAELMAQLAVLLGDEDLGLSFNWIGETTSSSMQRLKAANVAVFEVPDEADRAHQLSRAWMYIAPGGTRGFPSFLVEAMAAGLPCIAMDTPYHRDLIRHGETGYLCNSPEQVLDCVAQLIDFPELRQTIGAAAKTEAQARFDGGKFRDSLFAAYDMHPVPDLP